MKGFDGLETALPKIFNDKDKSDYVALNYDEITKGFTPSFIHQLECSIHPDHVWWKREKNTDSSQYDARCSAYLKMGGGKPSAPTVIMPAQTKPQQFQTIIPEKSYKD